MRPEVNVYGIDPLSKRHDRFPVLGAHQQSPVREKLDCPTR
jgi:hypothetical protein